MRNTDALQTHIECVRHDPDLVRCDTSDRGDQGCLDEDPHEERMRSGWRRPAHGLCTPYEVRVTGKDLPAAHKPTGHPEGIEVDVLHKRMAPHIGC